MDLNLDRHSSVPIAEQLQAQLRALIHLGELAPTEALPTIKELAASLDINYNTVAAVYRALEREGYLEQRRRGGTRVVSQPPQDAQQQLVVHLSNEFGQKMQALGVGATDVIPLLVAQGAAKRTTLRVAVIAANPLDAAALAARVQAILGEGFRCLPLTPPSYESSAYHLTVIDPRLVPEARTFHAGRENNIPLQDSSPWSFSPDYPAGAD